SGHAETLVEPFLPVAELCAHDETVVEPFPPVAESSAHDETVVEPFLPVAESSAHAEPVAEFDVQNSVDLQSSHDAENSDDEVTKEFPVMQLEPVEEEGELHIEWDEPHSPAQAAHVDESTAAVSEAADTTAPLEMPDLVVAEESYAEISSQLQEEISANDKFDEPESFEAATASLEPAPDYTQPTLHSLEPAIVAPPAGQGAPPFVTETMAELLVSQGFVGRAIEIYEELVHRNAGDNSLAARLDALRVHEAALSMPAMTATPTPRYNTPIRNTPHHTTPQFVTAQHGTPVRTARDRFAELASRRVPRRTPARATAVADDASDGLSSLFGTTQPTSPDELAARALADAFGPVQDTGESLFDLSSASAPTPLRAFTPRSVTAVHTPAAMPASDSRPAQPSTSDYSFDRFFPDPAVATQLAQSSAITPTLDAASAPPANEDLAQFSAWLKGLNNA
ncbi:MAG: hypothetical protein M3Y64_02520, partial [Gemmatimonadota bacterium]|nr:hypothetical protein [Gemmatimonadota bacterium]